MPAAAAGPPFVARSTSNPSFTGKSSASLSQPPTGSVSTPRNARCTRPSVIKSVAIFFAVLMGMANPMPAVVPLGGPDEFCRVVGLVAKNDFDGLRSFHDVKIRENVAARVNHETGAGAFDRDRVHKEIIFGGFGKNICDRWRSLAINAHVDGFVVGENAIALRYRSCRIRAAERQCFDFGRSVRTVSRTGPIRAKN